METFAKGLGIRSRRALRKDAPEKQVEGTTAMDTDHDAGTRVAMDNMPNKDGPHTSGYIARADGGAPESSRSFEDHGILNENQGQTDPSNLKQDSRWTEPQPLEEAPWYNWHPVASCEEIAEHFPSNLGKAIEYIYRSPFKADPIHDLEWAIHFLKREQSRIQSEGHDLASASVEARGQLSLIVNEEDQGA